MALEPGVCAALVDIVGGSHVSLDLAARQQYSCRLTDVFVAVPDAVVFPASTGQVSELVRGAAACGMPIAQRSVVLNPAGAMHLGTGGIVLSLERMNRLIDVDMASGVARIQPHATAEKLRSSIGLNLTDPARPLGAAQTDPPRSGTTILGLEAVLPTGEIVRTGGSLLARELGEAELADLLARPDGTLAVITELTICLDPSRAQPYIALAHFPSVAAACAAARTVTMSEIPTRLNFLDRQDIGHVEDSARLGLRRDAQALLLFTVAHQSAECRAWFAHISRICTEAGSMDARVCDDPISAATLLRAAAQNGAAARSDPGLVPTFGELLVRDLVAPDGWFG